MSKITPKDSELKPVSLFFKSIYIGIPEEDIEIPQVVQENISLVPLEDALASADVVCVLVKHSAFIHATQFIHAHPCSIDVVGLPRRVVSIPDETRLAA